MQGDHHHQYAETTNACIKDNFCQLTKNKIDDGGILHLIKGKFSLTALFLRKYSLVNIDCNYWRSGSSIVTKADCRQLKQIWMGNWGSNEFRLSVFVCQQLVASASKGMEMIYFGNCCKM